MPKNTQSKRLLHEGCGGIVDRRSLVCDKCGVRPPADKLRLVRAMYRPNEERP